MAFLTKKQIKQAKDHCTESVYVSEWGGEVLVRSMTAKERDEFEFEMGQQIEGKRPVSVRSRLVMITCVDEAGGRIFTEGDLPWLEEKAFIPMNKVATVARRLSFMSKEEMEGLEKNLEEDRADSSPSDSVLN